MLYGFESYPALPVIIDDGSFFGTICALDPEPRTASAPHTIALLEGFAAEVAALLSRAWLSAEPWLPARARARKARRVSRPFPTIVIAVPKGRILTEALPLLARAGIRPETAFGDEDNRALRFSTDVPGIEVIRVRAFDVATFVAHGAAQLGIVGSDVLAEFDYRELYAPVDLGIGHCRLSVAEPAALAATDDPRGWSHVRVATKYPHVTQGHFARRGVQAECVKLNGAMELAPLLGLAPRIVDLVSSGRTLRDNGLVEVEVIQQVTSRLVVNRAGLKTRGEVVPLVEAFRRAADGQRAA